MTANLGFVPHATKRHANEFASHRAGNRATQRRLSNAGRANKTQDRTTRVSAELANAQELEDALLDFVQVRVVGVEDRARVHQVELIWRSIGPWQGYNPVEVVACNLRFGPVGVHPLESSQLLQRFLLCFGIEPGFFDLMPVFVSLFTTTRIDFTQFVLDRAQLFAEKDFALSARHLFFRLMLDFGLHRGDFELASHQCIDFAKSRKRIFDFEHFLRFGESQTQVRGDDVCEAPRLVDVGHNRKHFGG